jgi:hypothetical protein
MQNSLGEVRVVTVVTVLAVAATSVSASRAPRPIRLLVEIGLRAKGNKRTKKAPRHEVAGRRDSARAVDSFFVASAIHLAAGRTSATVSESLRGYLSSTRDCRRSARRRLTCQNHHRRRHQRFWNFRMSDTYVHFTDARAALFS